MNEGLKEIYNLVRARVPIIWVNTHEEKRFVDDFLREIASSLKLRVSLWSQTSGLIPVNSYTSKERNTPIDGTSPIMGALNRIVKESESKNGSIFIMRDMFLNPMETRYLRDHYNDLADNSKTIIAISPFLAHMPGGAKEGLPITLEKQICVVNYNLPDYSQINKTVRNYVSSLSEGKLTKLKYFDLEIDEFTRALKGLTYVEIDNAIATCLSENAGELKSDHLISFKKQSIRKSQVLEFMETDEDFKDVGGLDKIKEYFGRYKNCFNKEAVDFGVEPLKLVIISGIPGVGKSLTCKTIGKLFKLPLIKLDMGRIFGSLVGSSEQRMREVISCLESNSPVICMIDEIEKGLSGTQSSGKSDGGTTSRVFGTLLTALQDGLKDVLFVATANDITSIPPEFIRRANEVFFVDLPSPEERWEILKIHIEKRDRKLRKYQDIKNDFLDASEDFTGAEIEKTVKDAIARAFYSGAEDLQPNHLMEALTEIKPIAIVMKEKIVELQKWAEGHARYASSYSEKKLTGESMDVDNETSKRFQKISKGIN